MKDLTEYQDEIDRIKDEMWHERRHKLARKYENEPGLSDWLGEDEMEDEEDD